MMCDADLQIPHLEARDGNPASDINVTCQKPNCSGKHMARVLLIRGTLRRNVTIFWEDETVVRPGVGG